MRQLFMLCGFILYYLICQVGHSVQARTSLKKGGERYSYVLIVKQNKLPSLKREKTLALASEIIFKIIEREWNTLDNQGKIVTFAKLKKLNDGNFDIPIKLTGDETLWKFDDIAEDIIHYRLNSFETNNPSLVKAAIERRFPSRYRIVVNDPSHMSNMHRIYIELTEKIEYKKIACNKWVAADRDRLLERFSSDFYQGDRVTVISLEKKTLAVLQREYDVYFKFRFKEVVIDDQEYAELSSIMGASSKFQKKLFAVDITRKQPDFQNAPIPSSVVSSDAFARIQQKHWNSGLVVRTINDWKEAFDETFPKRDKRMDIGELNFGIQARSSMTLIPPYDEPGIMLFQTGRKPRDCKKWKPRLGVVVDILGEDEQFKPDVLAAPVVNPAGTDTIPTKSFLQAIEKLKKLGLDRVKVGSNEILSLQNFRKHIKGRHIFNEIVVFNTKRSDVQGIFIHRADWDIANGCDGNEKESVLKQIFEIQESLFDDSGYLLPAMLYDHLTNSLTEISRDLINSSPQSLEMTQS